MIDRPDPQRSGTEALPLLQATCVLVGAGAVLIRGRPGSGKSSLAAALLSGDGPRCPVRLVGDDAVLICPSGGRLVAFAPDRARGLIEMRGLGLVAAPCEPRAVVCLVVDLVEPGAVERLPDPADAAMVVSGVEIPRLALPAGDAASPDRVRAALSAIRSGRSVSLAEIGVIGAIERIRA